MAHLQRKCSSCRHSVPPGARNCPACGSRQAVWVARYRGTDHRERSRSFERKFDAEAHLAGQETAKLRGEWVDPARGRVAFDKWADEWFSLKVARKPKTRAGYEAILGRHLRPRFGSTSIAEISPDDVSRFVAGLQASGLAANTVRNVYRVLSNIMRLAVKNRRIPQSPCIDVELPRTRPREMVALDASQIERLGNAIGEDYEALIRLAAYSGLRWGEIAALRVGRVDVVRATVDVIESASEVAGEVAFVTPKNGKTRRVRLPRSITASLAPLLADKKPDALVFSDHHDRPLRHGQFYSRVFRPAVRAAKLDERLRFHDLRHTCAALLIAQGAHPRAIMERLGHSSITVTMDVYGHLFPSLDQALADGLEAALMAAKSGTPRDDDGTVMGQVIPFRAETSL